MGDRRGEIVIPFDAKPWPHELESAKALAAFGHRLEFVPEIQGSRVKTADIVMDGMPWEIKSPESKSLRALQKNLHRALHQSHNVVIDSRRMKGVPRKKIKEELLRIAPLFKSLHHLILIEKDGSVIDIR